MKDLQHIDIYDIYSFPIVFYSFCPYRFLSENTRLSQKVSSCPQGRSNGSNETPGLFGMSSGWVQCALTRSRRPDPEVPWGFCFGKDLVKQCKTSMVESPTSHNSSYYILYIIDIYRFYIIYIYICIYTYYIYTYVSPSDLGVSPVLGEISTSRSPGSPDPEGDLLCRPWGNPWGESSPICEMISWEKMIDDGRCSEIRRKPCSSFRSFRSRSSRLFDFLPRWRKATPEMSTPTNSEEKSCARTSNRPTAHVGGS